MGANQSSKTLQQERAFMEASGGQRAKTADSFEGAGEKLKGSTLAASQSGARRRLGRSLRSSFGAFSLGKSRRASVSKNSSLITNGNTRGEFAFNGSERSQGQSENVKPTKQQVQENQHQHFFEPPTSVHFYQEQEITQPAAMGNQLAGRPARPIGVLTSASRGNSNSNANSNYLPTTTSFYDNHQQLNTRAAQLLVNNQAEMDGSFNGYSSREEPHQQWRRQQQQQQQQMHFGQKHAFSSQANHNKQALVRSPKAQHQHQVWEPQASNFSQQQQHLEPGKTSTQTTSQSLASSTGSSSSGYAVAMPNHYYGAAMRAAPKQQQVSRNSQLIVATSIASPQNSSSTNKQLNSAASPYQYHHHHQVNNNCSIESHFHLPQLLLLQPNNQNKRHQADLLPPSNQPNQQASTEPSGSFLASSRSADANNSNYYVPSNLEFNPADYSFSQAPPQGYFRTSASYNQQPEGGQPIDFHLASYKLPAAGLSRTLAGAQVRENRSHTFGPAALLKVNSGKKKSALSSLFATGKQASNTIHLSKPKQASASNSAGQRSSSLKRVKSSPLSAQQASYEAMRTIDMYLIRQIARSCMDFEMEQKIELEIRLRELAAQSMLEATNELDLLEVEKSLLTSDQRMNCYATQLEQQRKRLSNPSISTDSGRSSKKATGRAQQRANSSHSTSSTDLLGRPQTSLINNEGSSPSFSSLSNSQSPSKLSPVSGESANSPSFTATTNSSHHSRTGALKRSTNALSVKHKARNKRREHLMQNITSLSNINCNMVLDNRASLSISELRIPLMWRDVDHFKGKGDYKRYAVFCLLKIDSQIYDTQLISDVDRDVTDITFDDLVVFNEVEHNFELCLEIYSCVYLEQFSLASTPRKLKEKLTNSVSKAMGRRLATQTASENFTRELQAYDKSYRFAMIASAVLKLEDASSSVKTYDLVLVSPTSHNRHQQAFAGSQLQSLYTRGSSAIATQCNTHNNLKGADKNTLPLFGHFCCKLMVVPEVFDKSVKSGFIKVATIEQPSSSPVTTTSPDNLDCASSGRGSETPPRNSLKSNGHKDSGIVSSKTYTMSKTHPLTYYALLRNFTLHLWRVDQKRLDKALAKLEMPQIDNLHRPSIVLTIDKYTRLLRVSNTSVTMEVGQKGIFILAPYCSDIGKQVNQSDEMGGWLRAIEQSIYDSHIWGQVLNHYPPD